LRRRAEEEKKESTKATCDNDEGSGGCDGGGGGGGGLGGWVGSGRALPFLRQILKASWALSNPSLSYNARTSIAPLTSTVATEAEAHLPTRLVPLTLDPTHHNGEEEGLYDP